MLSTSFRVQAFAPQDSESAPHPLCLLHGLRAYVDRTSHFRLVEQLFVFFGGAALKGCQYRNSGCHIGLWKRLRWRMLLRMGLVREDYTLTPQEKWLRRGLGLKECRFRIFTRQQ